MKYKKIVIPALIGNRLNPKTGTAVKIMIKLLIAGAIVYVFSALFGIIATLAVYLAIGLFFGVMFFQDKDIVRIIRNREKESQKHLLRYIITIIIFAWGFFAIREP